MAVAAPIPMNQQRIAFLPTGQLRIDPTYQRDLSEPRVRKMAENWDEAKADTITVSARDGGFYVLDGQHRLIAARRAGVRGLWALIHEGLDSAGEAELFVALNTERARPKAIQLFKSRLTFDPVAQAIHKTAEDQGWVIQLRDFTLKGPRHTLSVGALDKLYQVGGPDLIAKTLRVVGQAWPDDADNGRADILLAVGEFIAQYQTHRRFQASRLAEKLSEKPVVSLRQRMRAFYSLSGGGGTRPGGDQSRAGVEAILETYNRALRAGHLPQLTASQRQALRRDPDSFVWPSEDA